MYIDQSGNAWLYSDGQSGIQVSATTLKSQYQIIDKNIYFSQLSGGSYENYSVIVDGSGLLSITPPNNDLDIYGVTGNTQISVSTSETSIVSYDTETDHTTSDSSYSFSCSVSNTVNGTGYINFILKKDGSNFMTESISLAAYETNKIISFSGKFTSNIASGSTLSVSAYVSGSVNCTINGPTTKTRFAIYKITEVVNNHQLKITDSGLTLTDEYVIWNDLKADIFGKKLQNTTGKLDYDFSEGVLKFQSGGSLSTAADVAYISFELDHGTDFSKLSAAILHIHYFQDNISGYTMDYKYRIQYNGQAKTVDWTSGSTSFGSNNSNDKYTYSSGTLNQISKIISIDLSNCNISDIVQIKITRSDTSNTSDLLVTYADMHIAYNRGGSKLPCSS